MGSTKKRKTRKITKRRGCRKIKKIKKSKCRKIKKIKKSKCRKIKKSKKSKCRKIKKSKKSKKKKRKRTTKYRAKQKDPPPEIDCFKEGISYEDYKACLYKKLLSIQRYHQKAKKGAHLTRLQAYERIKLGLLFIPLINQLQEKWGIPIPIKELLDVATGNEKVLRFCKLKLNQILINHISVGEFLISFLPKECNSHDAEQRLINENLLYKIHNYFERALEVIPMCLRYINHNLLEYVETRSRYFMRMLNTLLELSNCRWREDRLYLMIVKNFYMLICIFYKGICRVDSNRKIQGRFKKGFGKSKEKENKQETEQDQKEFDKYFKETSRNRQVLDLNKVKDLENKDGEILKDEQKKGRNKYLVHNYLLTLLRVKLNLFPIISGPVDKNTFYKDFQDTLKQIGQNKNTHAITSVNTIPRNDIQELYTIWRKTQGGTVKDQNIQEYMDFLYQNINDLLDNLAHRLEIYKDTAFMNKLMVNIEQFHDVGGKGGRAGRMTVPETLRFELESETASLNIRFNDLISYMNLLPREWEYFKDKNEISSSNALRHPAEGVDNWFLPTPEYESPVTNMEGDTELELPRPPLNLTQPPDFDV
jgi:hypothetical protein